MIPSRLIHNNNSKQRGARMSKNQQEAYIKFLEENPNYSSGTNSISYDLGSREKDFERLVEILNGTVGAIKDRKRWQETLADWRSKLLKRYRFNYSPEVRKSMTAQQIRNLKKFDEFDIRALKALGKWENEECLNKLPGSMKRKSRRKYRNETEDDDNDDGEYEEEDDYEDEQFEDYSNDDFSTVNVKTEVEYDDPLIEEESQVPVIARSETMGNKRRRIDDGNDGNDGESHSTVIDENTKAIKQHTAAIMGLTDSINALTSTIRSYLYNK